MEDSIVQINDQLRLECRATSYMLRLAFSFLENRCRLQVAFRWPTHRVNLPPSATADEGLDPMLDSKYGRGF